MSMTTKAMRASCAIFEKICDSGEFKITRPEAETLWVVQYDYQPSQKQIDKLAQLGWFHDESDCTFSQYF